MTEVVLFHHALGSTAGVTLFADDLRRAGHVVHTPDLYDGETFADLKSGFARAEQIGVMNLVGRGIEATATEPSAVMYAGFSLGVLPAQMLAQTRRGARGALLVSACVPPGQLASGWPDDVRVQVHGMEADPIFAGEGEADAARALVASTAAAELFLYPGDQHLFADRSLRSYDADPTRLLLQRTLDLLA